MTQDEDSDFRRLANGLSLADSPCFYIMISPTPEAARQAIDVLPGLVAEQRGEPVTLSRVDPYDGLPDSRLPVNYNDKDFSANGIAQYVMPRLAYPEEKFGDNKIVVLDASRARPEDMEAWGQMFRWMNERRNTLMGMGTGKVGTIPGHLVLCLPKGFEQTFVFGAPDFWSIRSGQVTLAEKGGVAPLKPQFTP